MARIEENKEFICEDGYHMTYRYFSTESVSDSDHERVIILLHREDSFPCGVGYFLKNTGLQDCQFLLLDIVSVFSNHVGKSEESNISSMAYHFQKFIEHAKVKYKIKEQDISIISLYDHAVVVSIWIIDYAPAIRSVVFYSPVFFFERKDILIAYLKNKAYSLYKKLLPKNIDTDIEVKFKDNNHHPFKKNMALSEFIPWNTLNDILFTGRRISRSAFSYHIPTQIIISNEERLSNTNAQIKFYSDIGSNKKEIIILRELHANDPEANELADLFVSITKFINLYFSTNNVAPSLFDSHERGVTKDEYEKLRNPETNVAKRLYWTANKFVLKHLGRFSHGINLGLNTGFDSGASLDYIYRNEPAGGNFLGKIIDSYYLKNIGWHCTRMRKKHVEELMLLAGQRLSEEHEKIKILDIAAGHGSYIINTIEKMPHKIDHVLMRDFEQSNILNGARLIQENKLEDLVTFEQGDAFSEKDLSTLPRDRTLTIVSGFYELFSDNHLVLTSLNGIKNATEEGGYLIYTTKLWNPKLDYMARVLISHKQGEYWLLRRRSQLEIDQLVNQAGFIKITQKIDPWGMFSVAIAKKMTP